MASIVITGFMATGKSTVGRRVAQRLGRPFVDTDHLVEERVGRSIAQIFATEGEAHFRGLERNAIVEACAMRNAVIAIGGGALGDEENRRRLLAAGPLVCLEASPEDILARVGDARTRPLLAAAPDKLTHIRELMAAREPLYRLATHRIDTSGLGVEAVADRVCAAVG